MTDFLTMAATMQTLSVAAMEEASRDGRREGDIEHVLLALVINEQTAGRALRSVGITLDAAREAVRAQHREQLQQLGVSVDDAEPGRIVFHETDGYDWTDRALMIMSRSMEGSGRGDAASILRRLLNEPSGLIEQILERLGTTVVAVRAALDEVEQTSGEPSRGRSSARGWVRGRFDTFAPAPLDDVWALVSDAERMPEWEPMVAHVERESGSAQAWIAVTRSHRPDGKPIKIEERFRRRSVTRAEILAPTRVIWRFEYPDAPAARPRTLALELSMSEGGTHVVLTSAWRRRSGWRWLIGLPLRPLQRYFVWLNLFHTAGAISRAFRQDP